MTAGAVPPHRAAISAINHREVTGNGARVFDPVLFIKEDAPTSVDLSQTPFFCNIHGFPHYCAEPPTGLKLLEPATSDPKVAIGNAYRVLSATTTRPDPKYGNQTRLEFQADQVEYEAIAVTHQTAAAFGMTLIEPGQGVRITSPSRIFRWSTMSTACLPGTARPMRAPATACWARSVPTSSITISRMSSPPSTRTCRW
jgi:hypothetical protein